VQDDVGPCGTELEGQFAPHPPGRTGDEEDRLVLCHGSSFHGHLAQLGTLVRTTCEKSRGGKSPGEEERLVRWVR